MFNNHDFPYPLEEERFSEWLDEGRQHKFGFTHVIIIWDELESAYKPVYTQSREELEDYVPSNHETSIAAYDLYSESRVK